VVAALMATLLPAAGHATAPPAPPSAVSASSVTDSSVADPRTTAAARAHATGVPVTVDALTTQYSTTTANPDGSFTATVNVTAQRVQRNGTWTPVDARLVTNPDDTLSPAASLNPLRISRGGTGPLATLTNGTAILSYTWPAPLPPPTVSGNVATYPNVYPGVDLRVTANTDGGLDDTLIVRDATAAVNPALADIQLGVTVVGATMRDDGHGNSVATAPDGHVVFTSGAPSMWDSSGAHATPVARTDTATKQDLRPPATALTGAHIVYPVFIDPSAGSPSPAAQHFTELQEAYPTTSTYDVTGSGTPQEFGEGIGIQDYSCSCGIEQSLFQVGMPGGLGGARVQDAHVQGYLKYAAAKGSQVHPIWLWSECPISAANTWDNQPCADRIANPHFPNAVSSTTVTTITQFPSPETGFQLDAGYSMQTAINNNWPNWTFGLTGDQGHIDAFARVDPKNISLSINYDFYPDQPINLRSNPLPRFGNTWSCASGGWLGRADGSAITLYADVHTKTPGMNLQGHFWLSDVTTNAAVLNSAASAWVGGSGTVQVSTAPNTLANGHQYNWHVTDTDGTLTGPDSPVCQFTTDFDAPDTVTVTPSGSDPTKVTVSAHDGGSGLWCYEYLVGDSPTLPTGDIHSGCNTGASGDGLSAPKILAPANCASGTCPTLETLPELHWGTNTMMLDAVDRAGNRTQPVYYTFYVSDSQTSANPVPGDLTGDQLPDLLTTAPDGSLRVYPGGTDPAVAGTDPTVGGTQAAPGYYTAAPATAAPNNSSFAGYDIVHRGSLHQQNVDDLIAYKPGDANLFLYKNSGTGVFAETPIVISGTPVTCIDGIATTLTPDACGTSGGTVLQQPDFSHVLAMTAPGTTTTGNPYNANTQLIQGAADLITVERGTDGQARLWLYHGEPDGFADAELIGDNTTPGVGGWDWAHMDLLAPGDATNTTDGNGNHLPDLWARDRVTGAVYQFHNSDTSGTEDPSSLGRNAVVIGKPGVLPASTYPQVTATGYRNNSTPDIYSTAIVDNTVVETLLAGGTVTRVPLAAANWTGGVLEGNATNQAAAPIHDFHIGMCLDDNGSLANGTRAVVYTCNATANQNWQLTNWGGIEESSSGMCLSTGIANTTPVQLSTCTPAAPNQGWLIQPDANGDIRIVNPNSGRCLDDPGASTTNGTALQIYDCNKGDQQSWSVPGATETALDTTDLALGKPVTASSSIAGNNTWTPTHLTDGTANGTPTNPGFSSNSSGSANSSQSVTVDLSNTHTLNEIDLYPRNATVASLGMCFPTAFTIATSTNNTTWTTTVTETNYPHPGGTPQQFTLANPTSARYIRVTATALTPDNFNNFYLQLKQLAAYGS
jgi:hypothetical protein